MKNIKSFKFFYLVLFFFLLVFYRTYNYSYDAVGFAASVETGNLTQLFHPYHLLYTYIFYLFYKIIIFFFEMRALYLGQFISMIFSVAILFLFSKFMEEYLKDKFLSLLSLVYLSVTYWFWFYSMDFELHIPNMFLLIVTLTFLKNYFLNSTFKNEKFIYLSAVFLMLMHQINFLFCIVLFFVTLIKTPFKKRMFLFWLISVLAVLAVYLCVAIFFIKINDFNGFMKWLTRYQNKGYWDGITNNYLYESLKGISFAITGGGIKKLAINFIIILFSLISYILYTIKTKLKFNHIILLLFFLYSGIIVYWHPANPENWWSIIFLIIMFFSSIDYLAGLKIFSKFKMKIYIAIIFLIIFQIIMVFKGYIYKMSFQEKIPEFRIIKKLSLKTSDIFLCLGENEYARLNVFIPYFTKYNFTSLAIKLDEFGSDINKTILWFEKLLDSPFDKIYILDDFNNKEGLAELSRMHKNFALPFEVNRLYSEFIKNKKVVIIKCK